MASSPNEAELRRSSLETLDKACSLFEEYVHQVDRKKTAGFTQELARAKSEAEEARQKLKEFEDDVSKWRLDVRTKREAELRLCRGEMEDWKAKTTGQRLHLERLQETFQAQRSRALHLDGHFQVMDDPFSQENLIKKYRRLYEDADLCCQQLEDLCEPEKSEDVADKGEEFFKMALKESFKQSKALLQKIYIEIARLVEGSQSEIEKMIRDPQAMKQSATSWFERLVKEVLRANRRTNNTVPQELAECTLKALREDGGRALKNVRNIFRTTRLIGLLKKDNKKVTSLMEEFVKKATEICWHLAILPNSIDIEDPVGVLFAEEFHERNALSDSASYHVERCLWPGLVLTTVDNEHRKRHCLLKAVVFTQ